jgi:hypothetical protein
MQRNLSGGIGARDELDLNLFSLRIRAETEHIETRHVDGRYGAREPVDENVRFLSVKLYEKLHKHPDNAMQ